MPAPVKEQATGISIIDADGKLVPPMVKILEVMKRIQTGSGDRPCF